MATSSSSAGTGRSLTPAQAIALGVGIVYTLVGILGFAVTGVDDFATANTGETLLGFELNPLHNLIHLAVGVAGLAMWRQHDTARSYGWLLFAAYGAVFIYGLFVAGDSSSANFLSLNGADNGLHLLSAVLGLAAALMPARRMGTMGDTGTGARA